MHILKSSHLNGWLLFYWIAGINAVAVIAYMPTQDLTTPEGVSEMIQMTVRCAVPFVYLAFAASSINVLFPGNFSRWMLRNRRSIGFLYAAAMAWQLFFILWLWSGHWEYYTEEVYTLEDILFQVSGYTFIFAMTVTSFQSVRRRMSVLSWRVLHKTGIYLLWYTVLSTYVYEIAVYQDRQIIDYIFAVAGFLAYGMRVAAWARTRVAYAAQA